MMNPVPWLQMTNMISYQGLVRTFPRESTPQQQTLGYPGSKPSDANHKQPTTAAASIQTIKNKEINKG
ncbi:hypothetical protein ACLHZ6_20320, partial [Aeromonas rivipollensis]